MGFILSPFLSLGQQILDWEVLLELRNYFPITCYLSDILDTSLSPSWGGDDFWKTGNCQNRRLQCWILLSAYSLLQVSSEREGNKFLILQLFRWVGRDSSASLSEAVEKSWILPGSLMLEKGGEKHQALSRMGWGKENLKGEVAWKLVLDRWEPNNLELDKSIFITRKMTGNRVYAQKRESSSLSTVWAGEKGRKSLNLDFIVNWILIDK